MASLPATDERRSWVQVSSIALSGLRRSCETIASISSRARHASSSRARAASASTHDARALRTSPVVLARSHAEIVPMAAKMARSSVSLGLSIVQPVTGGRNQYEMAAQERATARSPRPEAAEPGGSEDRRVEQQLRRRRYVRPDEALQGHRSSGEGEGSRVAQAPRPWLVTHGTSFACTYGAGDRAIAGNATKQGADERTAAENRNFLSGGRKNLVGVRTPQFDSTDGSHDDDRGRTRPMGRRWAEARAKPACVRLRPATGARSIRPCSSEPSRGKPH